MDPFVFCDFVVGGPELATGPIAFVGLLFGVHRVVSLHVVPRRT